jgi:coenzyme F420-0:L-glutamate ligase / coenzyme F420-1:gamma-L-glutamate ligase
LNDFAQFARSRRSIRRYEARPIPQAVLEELVSVAGWSPSAHNRQPWRFAVIRTVNASAVISQRITPHPI